MRKPTNRSSTPGPVLEDRLDEIEALFIQADGDGDQEIDLPEFRSLMRDLDPEMADSTVAIGFQAIDTDHDGRIDLGEFREWWTGS